MKRFLVTGVLAVACIAGLVAVGAADAPVATTAPSQTPRVAVGNVGAAPPFREHVFHGVTRPADRAAAGFPLGGRLVARHVEVGDTVAAGDPIAELDAAPFDNQVDAARATIDEVDTRLAYLASEEERAQRLIDARVGNTQTLEGIANERRALEATRRAARAQLSEARRQRSETTLVAPIAGTVAEVFANTGEVVGPGTPIASIAGLGVVEVEFDVPEGVFDALGEGDEVDVVLPLSNGRRVAGTLTGVSRSAAGRGRLFPAVVRLDPAADVAPGMAAEVHLRVARAAALTVPIAAVIDPTGADPHVIAIRDGVASPVSVTPLELRADVVLVDGALSAGEEVVVTGHAQVEPGTPVDAVPAGVR